MTCKELVDEWLAEKRYYVKASTLALYKYQMEKYILPAIGKHKITDITEDMLQMQLRTWEERKTQTGEYLKQSTIQNLITLIKQTLHFAVRKEYINSCNVKLYWSKRNVEPFDDTKMTFSHYEQQLILQHVADILTPEAVGIALCLCGGLRIGEICALQWRDIDLGKRTIRISKTVQRIYNKETSPHTQIVITSPKTQTSNRIVPLSERMYKMLIALSPKEKDSFFLSGNNYPIEPRRYRKYYQCFLVKSDIPYRKFHALRHTFATRCVENGGDYKCISELLGHSSIHIAMNRYVHPGLEQKRYVVGLLDKENY